MAEETSSNSIRYYELTDGEHEKLCGFVRKGFKDSLGKFLEEITSDEASTVTVLLSDKTFNPDEMSTRIAPLTLAALEGRTSILNLFLEVFKSIIDVNHGSYLEYPDLYIYDIKQVQGFNTRGVTALNAACVSGLTDIAKKLVQFGASINKPDHFGYSPLGNAARYGRLDTVDYLLRRGADVSHKTHDGYTPMHLAALHGQHTVVDLMLKRMISPLFPKSKQLSTVPCPLFMAAAKGWQPVVDTLTSHESCPALCKIDATLLLGCAARMFWRDVSLENRKGIVGFWIKGRELKDTREIISDPVEAYGDRKEFTTEAEFAQLSESEQFEEESLYQSLIIHERCIGQVQSYNWIFLAGMKMFERKHFIEAEKLWKRAMNKHYEMAQQHVGSDTSWQHDLMGTMEYMIKFSSSLEVMVKNGYTPMWEEYIDYALQQLKIGILTSLQSNLLDTSAGILKIYYCLLQILSCWIDCEIGQPNLPVMSTDIPTNYPEALQRAGQSFVDTASVLTQTNLLHILIYPSAPLFRGIHWQSHKRIPGLLLALLHFGSINAINDMDHCGNRPLHVAAKLPNKLVRDAVISVFLASGAHLDALNKSGMTPRQIFKISYPHIHESCFPRQVPNLICLVAMEMNFNGIEYTPSKYSSKTQEILRLHSLGDTSNNTFSNSWITLPNF